MRSHLGLMHRPPRGSIFGRRGGAMTDDEYRRTMLRTVADLAALTVQQGQQLQAHHWAFHEVILALKKRTTSSTTIHPSKKLARKKRPRTLVKLTRADRKKGKRGVLATGAAIFINSAHILHIEAASIEWDSTDQGSIVTLVGAPEIRGRYCIHVFEDIEAVAQMIDRI